MLSSNARYIIILLAMWIVLAILVNPAGEFPIGDDWSYSKAVHTLMETGEVRLTGWTSMPLIVQIYWGALFSLPFGFSFIALRLSTLVLGFMAGAGVFYLNRGFGLPARFSFICALLSIFNPFFYQLSFTFATDVPFFAFAVWSAFFFVRFFQKRNATDFVLAIILSCMTALIRDIGIALPLSFSLIILFNEKFNKRSLLFSIIAISMISFVWFGYRSWLEHTQGLPELFDDARHRMMKTINSGLTGFVGTFAKNLMYVFLFIGLYSFPAIFLKLKIILFKDKKNDIINTLLLCSPLLLILISLILIPGFTSTAGNFLTDFVFCGNFNYNPFRGSIISHDAIKHIAVIIGLFGIAMYGLLIIKEYKGIIKKTIANPEIFFLIILVIIYVSPILIAGVFNRYLIFLIPFVILISELMNKGIPETKKFRFIQIVSICVMIIISLGASRDLMETGRAKWEALNYLTNAMKIPAAEIDGGFEFNGWNNYDPGYIQQKDKNWWWVIDDKYMVSTELKPGYEMLKEYEYSMLLAPGARHRYMILLRKE